MAATGLNAKVPATEERGDLLHFLSELRGAGFAIGVEECVRAEEALAFAERLEPGSNATLRNVLAPILCTNPDQQALFYERFEVWCRKGRRLEPVVAPPLVERAAVQEIVRATRLPVWGWVGGAVGLLLVAVGFWFLVDPGPDPPKPPQPPCVEGVDCPKTATGSTTSTSTPTSTTVEKPSSSHAKIRHTALTIVASDGNPLPGAKAKLARFAVLEGHTGSVKSASFSASGDRVVTASYDGTARLWDTFTGAEIAVLEGHTSIVVSAAFSASGDRVVTASDDTTARLWDAATGAEIAVLERHWGAVNSAAFNATGDRVVTASDDTTARLWDAATGAEIAVLEGHMEGVWSAAFNATGDLVVTASGDNTARLWDAATGAEIAVLEGHTGTVNSAAFNATGNRVVTTSNDKTARMWDVATGAEIAVLEGHTGEVNSAAFNATGDRVVTASGDKTARLWDAATGAAIAVLEGHTDWVYSAAFNATGDRVVTASADRTARLWDTFTGAEIVVLEGHTDWVRSAAFNSTDDRVVTASGDKTARLWDAAIGAEIAVLEGHTDEVLSAAFNATGDRVVTASSDKTARLWDAATGAEIAVLEGHKDQVNSAAFNATGDRVVTASWDTTIRLWDAATGAEIAVLEGHGGPVFSAAFNVTGDRVVTASDDKTARLWDAATGAEIATLEGHTHGVRSAAFNATGDRVVTASWDKTARLWDAATGTEIAVLDGHTGYVASAAFDATGERVVTSSGDNTARLWDAATGAEIAVLEGHTQIVWSAAFNATGDRVVTASWDKTARLWDAATGAKIAVLEGHRDQVNSAAFNATGDRVVISAGAAAHIWWVGDTLSIGPTTNLGIASVHTSTGSRQLTVGASTHVVPAVIAPAQPQPLLLELAETAGWWNVVRKYSISTQALIASVFLLAYAIWMIRRWRSRKVILELRHVPAGQASSSVAIAKPKTELYRGTALMDVAQLARNRVPVASTALDVDATVKATIARLGFPSPVFSNRMDMPVYLALVDDHGPGDQAASRVDELLNRLARTGVVLERFYFDRDPRMLRPQGGGKRRALQELIGTHGNCRLLLFTDGAGLLHPLTGRVRTFVSDFDQWAERALLTPEAVDHWGQREIDLARTGFALMPGSLAGLGAYLEQLDNNIDVDNGAAARMDDPWRPPYPESLRLHPEAWLDTEPPQQAEANELCAQLRTYLGGHGYRWLSALAVYPQLNWYLTLHLGLSLQRADGSPVLNESNLIDLTRLPWLRNGSMPLWLRVRLISELPKPDEQQVRNLLRNLMEQQLESDTFSLEFAGSGSDQERDWRTLLRRVFRTESAASPMVDQVFVSFLLGKRADALQFRAPDGWRRYVFNHGVALLGLRPTIVAALMLMAAGSLVWGVQLAATIEATGSRTSELWAAGGIHEAAENVAPSDWVTRQPTADLLGTKLRDPLAADARMKAVTPDGSRLVTADGGKWARLWDTANGRLMATLEQPEGQSITDIATGVDSRFVRTTSEGRTMVWDLTPPPPE